MSAALIQTALWSHAGLDMELVAEDEVFSAEDPERGESADLNYISIFCNRTRTVFNVMEVAV